MAKLILVLTDKGQKAKVGFKNAHKPLGERTQEDLLEFGILARESGRKDYIGYFKDLPSLDKLKAAKTDTTLDAIAESTNPAPDAGAGAGGEDKATTKK